jgi:eukaryotic-like serine/threonine-protein kinase
VQPLVPGFTITRDMSSSETGSTWAAVRSHDDRALVVKVVKVPDVVEAQARATHLMALLQGIENEHLVHQHEAIVLADGTLALVLDQVDGDSLAHALGARGQLTPGETVTTVAPLFGALADLHAAGVVHGGLAPGKVLFSADGRPLISDLGIARLLGRQPCPVDETSGFVAPELLGGAAPSQASDVYAMAAVGWFCLTGSPPPAPATRASLTTARAETPPRLVEILTSCLSTDPAARPSAGAAAVEVFDAAAAESVRLGSVSDPAAEITRRIRAAAVSAPTVTPTASRQHQLPALVIGLTALLVAAMLGGGAAWFSRHRPVAVQPVAVRSSAQPSATSSTAAASNVVPPTTPLSITDVMTEPNAPRIHAAGLLQALVDARALAYVARNPALLDLVYAPGAKKAVLDQANIAAALKNGATYLGLAFVVKDVAFLDGTTDTARIRATIVTPPYRTGQPDGRKVSHAQESVGPSVFTVKRAPDGWRVLSLTGP